MEGHLRHRPRTDGGYDAVYHLLDVALCGWPQVAVSTILWYGLIQQFGDGNKLSGHGLVDKQLLVVFLIVTELF